MMIQRQLVEGRGDRQRRQRQHAAAHQQRNPADQDLAKLVRFQTEEPRAGGDGAENHCWNKCHDSWREFDARSEPLPDATYAGGVPLGAGPEYAGFGRISLL